MDYQDLVTVYEQLEGTTKRLEKSHVLSEFLKTLPEQELEQIALLVQGRVFPRWDTRELGVAAKIVVRAITRATGVPEAELERVWKERGDLGETAEQLTGKKQQATLFSETITINKVFDNLHKIATLEGQGTVDQKISLIAELLTSANPKEAKYIVRTVLQDLRIGLGEGTLRDSIVWAFFADKAKMEYNKEKNELILEDRTSYVKYIDMVQEAIDVANDFARVAQVAAKKSEDALREITLQPGQPVKVMLFQKSKDMQDAFETVGTPAAVEYKYDGFRLQIHKKNGKVALFTRRLENVTPQFPDVVKAVEEQVQGDAFILDGEVVGIDATGAYLPFQNMSQRIKRKYGIEEMVKKFPVQVRIFDALFMDKSLLKEPFTVRHNLLNERIKQPGIVSLADRIITDNTDEATIFYKKALEEGVEGVMVKNLEGTYKPGSRVGYGVKVKPTMDTLEVVIVGAEWGEGKRGQWLASFIVAVRDAETDSLREIGRVGTGIKEKSEGVSFEQMTQLLKPLITSEEGRIVYVKPEVVIEVDYEEIQASPTYTSGFALRFPRLVRLREDRSYKEINTVEDVTGLYKGQRGRGE